MKKMLQATAAVLLCAMLAVLPLVPVPVSPSEAPHRPAPLEPFFVTAEEITTYRGPLLLGGVGNYDVRYGEMPHLLRSPVGDGRDVKYLPAWQPAAPQDLLALAEEMAAQVEQNLALQYGLSPASRSVDAQGNSVPEDLPDFHLYCYESSTVELRYDDFVMEITGDSGRGAAELRCLLQPWENAAGEQISLAADASSAEVRAAVEPVVQFCSIALGKDFVIGHDRMSFSYESRQDGWLIYAWQVTGDPVTDLRNAYYDYLEIILDMQPDGMMTFQRAWCRKYLLEQSSEQLLPVIPVEEAAAQLAAGNAVYGWHCPVCWKRSDVDFTDYDAVEMICYTNMLFQRNVPVYAFYKQQRGRECAVAYYPAVEVRGLAEYFAAQHDHGGGDA